MDQNDNPTMPPGPGDADAHEYELAVQEFGERETRLEYLRRVCAYGTVEE